MLAQGMAKKAIVEIEDFILDTLVLGEFNRTKLTATKTNYDYQTKLNSGTEVLPDITIDVAENNVNDEVAVFSEDWFQNNLEKDVKITYTDGKGIPYEKFLLQSCSIIGLLITNVDHSAPEPAKIQLTLIIRGYEQLPV